mmetsp:Transcript_42665/g.68618  ORF Transcript_42665/g.68618 Transcript_42665/m.68618 type:complete len:481 (+) Transcript_42665:129-1571(+)
MRKRQGAVASGGPGGGDGVAPEAEEEIKEEGGDADGGGQEEGEMENEDAVERRSRPLERFFKRPQHLRRLIKVKSKLMLRATVTGDRTGTMRVRDYVKMPRTVQTIDKVSFTLGVVGLLVTQFVATEHPEFFWLYYLVSAPIIFVYRVIQYSMIKYHYFLIDFCYYANVACFVHILAAPSSATLFRSVFAYSNGPILWAIPLWRNSLVFHSHDKVQSVFIHTMPAILTWCTRWYGQQDLTWGGGAGPLLDGMGGDGLSLDGRSGGGFSMDGGGQRGRSHPISGGSGMRVRLSVEDLQRPMGVAEMATELYFWPVVGYVAWQVAYLVKTELWDVKRLDEDPELVTSLRWLANDYKTPVTRWALRTSRRIGLFDRDELFDASSLKTKFVFVSLQLIYTIVTFLPIPLCYVSKVFHTALMLLAFLSCIWNGAEYYIDIFSRRYAAKFEAGAATGSLRDEDKADSAVAEANGEGKAHGGDDQAS